jgi:hypothetical protein
MITYTWSILEIFGDQTISKVRYLLKAQADAQAVIDAKNSALAKLTALGLTQAEVTALVG